MRNSATIPDKMRKRFNIHLGSHKRTFHFSPEDRSRHYDFVDIPLQWRPASPLIERQHLTPLDEVQLRHACKVLCEKIAKGEISPGLGQSDEPESVKCIEARTYPDRSSLSSTASVQAHQHGFDAGSKNCSIEKAKYDSGVVLSSTESSDNPNVKATTDSDSNQKDTSEQFAQGYTEVGIAQFYPDESDDLDPYVPDSFVLHGHRSASYRIPRSSTVTYIAEPDDAHRITAGEMTYVHVDEQDGTGNVDSIKHIFVGPDQELTCIESADNVVRPTTRADGDTSNSQLTDLMSDVPSGPLPARTPSFSRPHALSRAASRRVPRNREVVPLLPTGSQETSIEQPRERHRSQQPLETGEDYTRASTGAKIMHIPRKSHGGVAVVVDTDGMEHMITATEEKQRYLDLQRAVMEKMFTGTIGTEAEFSVDAGSVDEYRSKNTTTKLSLFPKSPGRTRWMDERLVPAQPTYANENSPTETRPPTVDRHAKKPGIMHKLSVLGLGKKKSSTPSKNANIVGFSRIMEAS